MDPVTYTTATGIRCAIANQSGTGFVDPHNWAFRSEFTDSEGWNTAVGYYGSIRLIDINADGLADLCGRGPGGLVCGINDGFAFDHAQPIMPHAYTDTMGWLADPYGTSIRLGDLGRTGRASVCGRNASGLQCGP